MPYEPIFAEGHHLGTSHEVEDAVTGHVFEDGTNALKGHAAWRWVDEADAEGSADYSYEPPPELTPEERQAAEFVAAALLAGIVLAVEAASPHVARWWRDKASPALRRARGRLFRRTRRRRSPAAVPAPSRFIASTAGVEEVLADTTIVMSRAEWEHRFNLMLAADHLANAQRQILETARIEESPLPTKAVEPAEMLTARQFANEVRRVIEANPAMLTSETATELMKVLETATAEPEHARRLMLE
ncbi:MAG: hypothetical protein JWP57_4459 [Spirosoma sp.]|nr:hypothetical protein [Spirosoma sp.]